MLKALSRSPIVIHQVLAIGEDLKRGLRSIKEIVVFDEEEITEKILQTGVRDTTCFGWSHCGGSTKNTLLTRCTSSYAAAFFAGTQ